MIIISGYNRRNMFCQKCGKEIADGSVACNFCGTPTTPEGKPAKAETSLMTVFEWGMAFAVLGLLLGGIQGAVMGFIAGFIVTYAAASVYDLAFRAK